jgi:hypothetical protein
MTNRAALRWQFIDDAAAATTMANNRSKSAEITITIPGQGNFSLLSPDPRNIKKAAAALGANVSKDLTQHVSVEWDHP